MSKFLFWGLIFAIGYFYVKPMLDAGKPHNNAQDDDDYITIKVPKKKKERDEEELSDYEEID